MDSTEPPSIVYAAPESPRAEPRALEIGAGAFLMSGGAVGAYAGPTLFVISEVSDLVSLRPSIFVGDSLNTGNVYSRLAAARFDTCVRVPGHYRSGNGIALDLCGGIGAGFSYVRGGTDPGAPPVSKNLPYIELGPSIGLRAEVGRLAVILRMVGGVDVARGGFDDATGTNVAPAFFTVRWELDFSWDLSGPRPVE